MGKLERIKRQKRLRAEKLSIQKSKQQEISNEKIVDEASEQLKNNLNPDYKLRPNIGPVKYSEVLTDFVDPLLVIFGKNGKDTEAIKHVYRLGILAWNLAILKKGKDQKRYINEINEAYKKLDELDINTIKFLMERKEEDFSDFNIMYVSFEIVNRKGDIGISTAVLDMNAGYNDQQE